jgi:hypothetical protein
LGVDEGEDGVAEEHLQLLRHLFSFEHVLVLVSACEHLLRKHLQESFHLFVIWVEYQRGDHIERNEGLHVFEYLRHYKLHVDLTLVVQLGLKRGLD